MLVALECEWVFIVGDNFHKDEQQRETKKE
jgi:hypothetical protein